MTCETQIKNLYRIRYVSQWLSVRAVIADVISTKRLLLLNFVLLICSNIFFCAEYYYWSSVCDSTWMSEKRKPVFPAINTFGFGFDVMFGSGLEISEWIDYRIHNEAVICGHSATDNTVLKGFALKRHSGLASDG